MERLKELEDEVADLRDLGIEGLSRHENSILVNVPKGLAEKGSLAVSVFMYYMDSENINEFTGNRTYMNVEEAYISSGVYSDSYLEKVYGVEIKEVEKFKGGSSYIDYEEKYYIKNKRENQRIRAEAMRYWQDNNLSTFFEEIALLKMGNIDPEKLLRVQIIQDALRDGENQIANRKMAIDILGMKVKKQSEAINLKTRGGQVIIETTAKREGAGFLGSYEDIENDDEIEDEVEISFGDD